MDAVTPSIPLRGSPRIQRASDPAPAQSGRVIDKAIGVVFFIQAVDAIERRACRLDRRRLTHAKEADKFRRFKRREILLTRHSILPFQIDDIAQRPARCERRVVRKEMWHDVFRYHRTANMRRYRHFRVVPERMCFRHGSVANTSSVA